jgi:hypothetical protein
MYICAYIFNNVCSKNKTENKKRFPTLGGSIYNARSPPSRVGPLRNQSRGTGTNRPFVHTYTDIITYMYVRITTHNTYNTDIAHVCFYRCLYVYMCVRYYNVLMCIRALVRATTVQTRPRLGWHVCVLWKIAKCPDNKTVINFLLIFLFCNVSRWLSNTLKKLWLFF